MNHNDKSRPMVVLDPGHGGHAAMGKSTPDGVRGPLGTLEKDVVLQLARGVAARLGGRVSLTRTDDTNLSLADRCGHARHSDARVFVSLHANAGAAGQRGSEAYVHSRAPVESRLLAEDLTAEMARFGGGGAGVLDGELAVLSPENLGPRTAACLLEVDYLSDAQAERRLRTPQTLDQLSTAIARGIGRYMGRKAAVKEYEEGQVAPAIVIGIIGLGIATFSLINAVSQREAGNLTWSRNITKSLHTYPQGTTANPWYDHYSRLFSFDAISGLSSVWAEFVLQYRYNGNDIDQCRIEKAGSSDYTISRLTVSFEGNDATSYEKDSTGCIMMYIGGTADPTGSGDIDFRGSILVKADGSCVNQEFHITRGDESDFTIAALDPWGYSLTKT
jgi:N-acetylmuramoyl-L-alanine amidase